jgi:phosphoribosyl-ATP pyrophosphohydrolase
MKLKTYKNKNGSYTTYVFNGGIKAIAKYTQKLKKHSVSMAMIAVDNNDFAGGRL